MLKVLLHVARTHVLFIYIHRIAFHCMDWFVCRSASHLHLLRYIIDIFACNLIFYSHGTKLKRVVFNFISGIILDWGKMSEKSLLFGYKSNGNILAQCDRIGGVGGWRWRRRRLDGIRESFTLAQCNWEGRGGGGVAERWPGKEGRRKHIPYTMFGSLRIEMNY